MPSENCKCPVKLLDENYARQLVRKGHRTKGEQGLRLAPATVMPPVRRPHRKKHRLLPGVANRAQPPGKLFGGKLAATRIEKHEMERRAGTLPLGVLEQSFFRPELQGLDRRKGFHPLEICVLGLRKKSVAAAGDMGQEKLH